MFVVHRYVELVSVVSLLEDDQTTVNRHTNDFFLTSCCIVGWFYLFSLFYFIGINEERTVWRYLLPSHVVLTRLVEEFEVKHDVHKICIFIHRLHFFKGIFDARRTLGDQLHRKSYSLKY